MVRVVPVQFGSFGGWNGSYLWFGRLERVLSVLPCSVSRHCFGSGSGKRKKGSGSSCSRFLENQFQQFWLPFLVCILNGLSTSGLVQPVCGSLMLVIGVVSAAVVHALCQLSATQPKFCKLTHFLTISMPKPFRFRDEHWSIEVRTLHEENSPHKR